MARFTYSAVLASLASVVLVAILAAPAAANMHGAQGRPAKPKDESGKAQCTPGLCNSGSCSITRGKASCDCSGTNFCGRTCEMTKASCEQKNAQQQEMQQEMDRLAKDRQKLKDKMSNCPEDKKHVCPNYGPKNGTCVAAAVDCFVDASGKLNATLMGKYRDKMKATKDACNKTKGEKYCFKEETCVGRGLPCAPQQECPADKPFRCVGSWKCQENATMCDNDAARPEPCPTGQQRCPDGECYDGTGGLKECVKQGMQWDSCPAGKMKCPADKRRCAASRADCATKIGCEAGTQMCGIQRDKTTGKAKLDATGSPQPRCVANCTMLLERKPKDKDQKGELNSATGGELTVETEDGRKAMRLKIRPKNFKNGDRAVNFTVRAVPDSLMQEGAFKAFHDSGSIMGSLIQIEPSEAIEIDGGIELDIPISSPEAQTDAALCAAMLDDLQMVSVGDITDLEAEPKSFGTCSKGELDGCSCVVNITHFSTYTVIDYSIAYSDSGTATSTATPASTPTPGTPASSVAGPLAKAPDNTKHYVELSVTMPYTLDEFEAEAVKSSFKKAVASAAGTVPENVKILSVKAAGRRTAGVLVQTKILALDAAALTTMKSTLGSGSALQTKLNTALKSEGLKESTGIKEPVTGISSAVRSAASATLVSVVLSLVLFAQV